MSRYTRWFRDGAINATNGSTEITGSGTYWESAGLNPGDMLEVDNSGLFYEIATINSDTSITLARAYQGTTVTGAAYAIVRNFTATMPSRVAAQTSDLIKDFRKYVDTDMERLTGRSAYELACLNGFVGTQADWLASLKGENAYQLAVASGFEGTESEWLDYLRNGGGFVELNEIVAPFTVHNAYSHNSIARGKNLGSEITAEQIAAIRSRNFKDLYIGDYWTFKTSHNQTLYAWIMHFIQFWNQASTRHAGVVVKFSGISWDYSYDNGNLSINDTNTCEGHIYNSKMYNEVLPAILAQVESYIDPSYILEVTDLVADAISTSTGDVSHRIEAAGKIFLPSARNLGLTRYDATASNYYKPYQNTGWQMLNAITWTYYLNNYGGDWGYWLASNENASSWHTGGTGFNGRCGVYPRAAGNSDGLEPFIIIG